MPVFGKQDVQAAAARAPLMSGLDTDPWELKDAEILQLSFEVVEEPAEWLAAPALHPSIPPYATLSVARFPDSPVGPYALAQVRLVVRAGIRPRAYMIGAYTDSEQAVAALRMRWGFPLELATVSLQARHDRVIGRVERDGQTILDMGGRESGAYLGVGRHLYRQPPPGAGERGWRGKTADRSGRSGVYLSRSPARDSAPQNAGCGGLGCGRPSAVYQSDDRHVHAV